MLVYTLNSSSTEAKITFQNKTYYFKYLYVPNETEIIQQIAGVSQYLYIPLYDKKDNISDIEPQKYNDQPIMTFFGGKSHSMKMICPKIPFKNCYSCVKIKEQNINVDSSISLNIPKDINWKGDTEYNTFKFELNQSIFERFASVFRLKF
mgnify:CR=1 FL=1|tara:strand:+ start:160 stop:609 length:450 start_codon:yes stop_codon:yes gene_type:complete